MGPDLKDQLRKLVSNLASYREAVDRLLSPDVPDGRKWREQLFDILISVAQLYLDYLLLIRELPAIEAASKASVQEVLRANTGREARLRKRLKDRLESVPHWNHFDPQNAFSELTGLRTRQDYINRFVLHLPEIYEESLRVEDRTKAFLTDLGHSSLMELAVGMEHIGRNHISFVLQALEWAVDDGSWDESH